MPFPQVLCGTKHLLALGRRAGLRLQCHATTSAAGTAAVVDSVARAWLAKWQAGGPGMQYAVAEAPTEEEAFLTRWASRMQGWHSVNQQQEGDAAHSCPTSHAHLPAGFPPSTRTAPRCCCRWACRWRSCCASRTSTRCRWVVSLRNVATVTARLVLHCAVPCRQHSMLQ